jgi:hypothetical protein
MPDKSRQPTRDGRSSSASRFMSFLPAWLSGSLDDSSRTMKSVYLATIISGVHGISGRGGCLGCFFSVYEVSCMTMPPDNALYVRQRTCADG